MAKTYEELASEMTVAWLNAVGNACASGEFGGNWLKIDVSTKAYQAFYNTLLESVETKITL